MDWSILLVTDCLMVSNKSRARCGDEDIRNTLCFIFGEKNLKLLAWGSIRVRKDGELVEFLVCFDENVQREYTAAIL